MWLLDLERVSRIYVNFTTAQTRGEVRNTRMTVSLSAAVDTSVRICKRFLAEIPGLRHVDQTLGRQNYTSDIIGLLNKGTWYKKEV